MHTVLHDLRYAVRQLVKAPAFTLTAVLTLANAIIVRPLPGVRAAEQLVWLAPLDARGSHPTNMSYPDYLDYRDGSGVFSELAAMDEARFSPAGFPPGAQRGWTRWRR